jgi:hypothetical protein
MRKGKELRERFEAADLEDLAVAELEVRGRALVRLNLLLASDDHRVALRAYTEIFGRILGKPRQQQEFARSRTPIPTWRPRWRARTRSSQRSSSAAPLRDPRLERPEHPRKAG